MIIENTNPALAEALQRAEGIVSLKDHINTQIVQIGKGMQQDTFELRSPLYTRKNYTIAALVAFDPEVRRLVQRAGVNLLSIDTAIANACGVVLDECNRQNPIGVKLRKAILDSYMNGYTQ